MVGRSEVRYVMAEKTLFERIKALSGNQARIALLYLCERAARVPDLEEAVSVAETWKPCIDAG